MLLLFYKSNRLRRPPPPPAKKWHETTLGICLLAMGAELSGNLAKQDKKVVATKHQL